MLKGYLIINRMKTLAKGSTILHNTKNLERQNSVVDLSQDVTIPKDIDDNILITKKIKNQ